MKKILALMLLISSVFSQYIICFGDSLTADGGYASYLTKWYTNAKISVVAKKGAMSKDVFEDVCDLALEQDYAIVLCGVNDIDRPKTVILHLELICRVLKKRGVNKVIALSLTPWKGYPTWTEEKQYNTYMVNGFILSKPKNVDFAIDLYSGMEDQDNPDTMASHFTTDKLHLSSAGHYYIAHKIKKILDSTLSL